MVVHEQYLEERIRDRGLIADERANPREYKLFRHEVTQRLCKMWQGKADITATISQKLNFWAQRTDLIGWVRGDEATRPEVMKELARLSQENRELRVKSSDVCVHSSFFYGNRKTPRAEDVFQDFLLPGKGNVNAVQYLWADASKSSTIKAEVESGRLRVRVKTIKRSYPCNVAIRGKCESALVNTPHKRYLVFGARLGELPLKNQPPISIAVRLVNGLLQHWVYGTGASSYLCETIADSVEWTIIGVDLDDANSWRRFESDGNPDGPTTPNFDCICSVVLEIGCEGNDRPDGIGSAVVDIAPILLLDNLQGYEHALKQKCLGALMIAEPGA